MVKTEIAILAGGCFWGVEDLLRQMKGVVKTEVGYTGGHVPNAKYELVKTGKTDHAEAVRIEFDPAVLSYADLLLYFFKLHDPTTPNQQGNDIGTQYRSAIFYLSGEQMETAKVVIERVNKSGAWGKPVMTEIVKASDFYLAEEYHQKYLVKNPGGYTCHYVRKVNF